MAHREAMDPRDEVAVLRGRVAMLQAALELEELVLMGADMYGGGPPSPEQRLALIRAALGATEGGVDRARWERERAVIERAVAFRRMYLGVGVPNLVQGETERAFVVAVDALLADGPGQGGE
jgi:hypothetical protein